MVPPEAVSVAICPAQIVGLFTVIVGIGLTVTTEVVEPVHPDVVPDTVYVVVDPGETLMGLVVAPVFHE